MPPPAMLAFGDGLENEWKGFTVFPGDNPRPNRNYNFLVKKAILESEKTTGSSAIDDSFRIVLPPAMPPPRDSAVPLPMLPEPMRIQKKLGRQEAIHFMRKSRVHSEEMNVYKEEDFKCNAFCLTLPGFGKHKTVRSSSRGRDSMEKKMMSASSFTYSTVSINASLEKFECSSWASTTALTQDHGRMYFDFPVEMMKCNSRGNGGRDVQEPVTSGFLFDRETETVALRSVLKTRSSRSSGRDHQRSAETSPLRRVRFSDSSSVSCPTSPRSCISPRLRQARDDFNTFLTAQNA